MKSLQLLLCLVALVLSSAHTIAGEKITASTYGEALTLEQEGGYASSLWVKAKYHLGEQFHSYIGMHGETYEPRIGGIRRVSPLAGIEKNFGPFRAFAEYRYAFEKPRTTYSKHDPRFGFTGGYWWQNNNNPGGFLFSDSYGELISIPRIKTAPNFSAYSKLGWRKPLSSKFYLDPYVELYANESSDPAMGRDALESRGGLRLVWADKGWSTNLSAFHRIFSLRNAPAARLRFQLAIGGEF